MEEVKLDGIHLDEFQVTRTHGVNAFYNLADAHSMLKQWKRDKQIFDQETPEDKYHNAGATGSRMRMAEHNLLSKLSAAVILYQASMEAILSIATGKDQRIADAVNNDGFKKNWLAALQAIDAETKEFEKYESEFYKGLRVPLIHLYPNTDNKLEKVKSITFKKVYNGMRYGWWAYIRLLNGIGLANDKYDEHWQLICQGKIRPNLFPDDHPKNL